MLWGKILFITWLRVVVSPSMYMWDFSLPISMKMLNWKSRKSCMAAASTTSRPSSRTAATFSTTTTTRTASTLSVWRTTRRSSSSTLLHQERRTPTRCWTRRSTGRSRRRRSRCPCRVRRPVLLMKPNTRTSTLILRQRAWTASTRL